MRVYLACGVTDMRRGIDGLSTLVETGIKEAPGSGAGRFARISVSAVPADRPQDLSRDGRPPSRVLGAFSSRREDRVSWSGVAGFHSHR
ncbi:IS66 family insertion sequence element accessory protein TnpB [Rhizobium sp. PP-CC-3G-465]|uniref:IS66 family insertion sequence element accessory protein TnpB n=1 Tax=Rhizobium sp. PP-CC-3G-465 TaxID=2135648 RepID=UPI003BA89170